MKTETEQRDGLVCDLAGPLLEQEAELLCPEILQDPAYVAQSGVVARAEQPDFPRLKAESTGPARQGFIRKLQKLDEMRRSLADQSGRPLAEHITFLPGYARRALVDGDAEQFQRLYTTASRVLSKEWRRWMEHAGFWNKVLGARWLGQQDVPKGPARDELSVMLGLRYALLPRRFPDVLPAEGLPEGVRIAVQLAQMEVPALQKPLASPTGESLRRGAISMLQGDWEPALTHFQTTLRTGNTAIYAISENALAPVLVYAYLCAIRAGAKRHTIQTWGDILQSILPAFCLRGESEGMVAFLHNLTVLDGVLNRRTMPAYVPDTEYDLACIPLALCYDRLSPQLRHKIGTNRLLQAIASVLGQGQLLLGYYAAQAISATTPLPQDISERLRPLAALKVAPLLSCSAPAEILEQSPAGELEHMLAQGQDENVELLHWELLLDNASGMIRTLRPRLRATNEQAVSHEVTLNQSASLIREPQDLAALQLARLLEQGDAAALRWTSALAGHPRLRLSSGGRRTTPISLVAEKPILNFQRKDGALTVTLEAREDGVLRRISDREWAVQTHSDLLETLREYFHTRGERGGITLPDAAADKLFAHYDRLTRCFEVRGTLAGTIAPVEGEYRMVASVTKTAEGYGVRLAVRVHSPSGTDRTPGEGPAHLDVRTPAGIVPVDRDLAREVEEADTVCRSCGLEVHGGRYEWHPATHAELLEALAGLERAGALLLQEGEEFRCISVEQETLEMRALYLGGEWFELGADLKVDENLVYTLRELLLAMESAEGPYVPVRNGYLRLNPTLQGRLQALKALAGINGRSFGISTAALPALALCTGSDQLPKVMRARLEAMQAPAILSAPDGLRTELRPYQLQGFRWLAERAAAGIGVCLADDMGLGKTVQLISLLLQRAAEGPSLVICPVSLISNWQQELERFAPSLRVAPFRTGQIGSIPQAGEVLLGSYGQVVSHLKEFCAVPWNVLALDEAQAVKNPESQRAKAVCALHAAVRVALTGTPVENSGMDLWSLMRFLNPLMLGSKTRFRRTYLTGKPAYTLRDATAPLILRRTKAEVLPQLPPFTEQIRYVELSDQERAVYEGARRNALQKLENAQDRVTILAELTRLRRACCHAQLLLPEYTGPASKLEEMLELVLSLRDSGHKALVFSQFTDVLDLAEPLLRQAGITYERLDGSTPPRQRTAAVKRFQAGSATVFLISLKAGGTGLNLTAADYVLLLDPWWNPAVEAQASSRSHRLGQTSPVTLYRLIASHTVEERVLALHQEKKDLAETILSSPGQIPLDSLQNLFAD